MNACIKPTFAFCGRSFAKSLNKGRALVGAMAMMSMPLSVSLQGQHLVFDFVIGSKKQTKRSSAKESLNRHLGCSGALLQGLKSHS